MKIDIEAAPAGDIMAGRKKYTLLFLSFLGVACLGLGAGVYAVYFSKGPSKNMEDISLGILVGASLLITWSGEKLQAYKRIYPPHRERLAGLRRKHPEVDSYCRRVEELGREMVRGEFLACTKYAEKRERGG